MPDSQHVRTRGYGGEIRRDGAHVVGNRRVPVALVLRRRVVWCGVQSIEQDLDRAVVERNADGERAAALDVEGGNELELDGEGASLRQVDAIFEVRGIAAGRRVPALREGGNGTVSPAEVGNDPPPSGVTCRL